jgi:hypothetical protein
MDGDYRQAVFTGLAAQRLAYDELNPAGLERARDKLAHAWLPVAEEADDDWTLVWTAYFAGCSRADIKADLAARRLEPLATALRSRSSSAAREEVVRVCTERGVGAVERTGMLLLLADLVDIWDRDLVARHVAPVVIGALRDGWGLVQRANVCQAACRLIRTCSNLLEPDGAAGVVAALRTLAEKTPVVYLDDLYVTLAQVLANVAISEEEAVATAGLLRRRSYEVGPPTRRLTAGGAVCYSIRRGPPPSLARWPLSRVRLKPEWPQ